MPKLGKGAHAPLNVTQESMHRIFVGLGWDPNQKVGVLDKVGEAVGGKKTWHDLDLSCFMYSADKKLIDSITAEPGNHIDESGHVYHSGDNVEGVGDGDDEQISVELKKLDENVWHLIFKATIKSGHVFAEVESPEIRLVDGYSDHTFLQTALNGNDGQDQSAFVFAHLYRKDDGWNIHNVNEYLNSKDVKDWGDFLKTFLDCK